MKKLLFTALALSIVLVLSGCGSSSPPPVFVTHILSDQVNDGDIKLTNGTFSVLQGNPGTVSAGVDPISGSEFRAFLDFPLTGPGGVPGSAIIESATLDIFIDTITIQQAAATIPILIELVSLPTQTLFSSYFDAPAALATKRTFIARTDVNNHVSIDVSQLMVQAQISGLANFRIRILEDFGVNVLAGLVEIDDTTAVLAPELEVVYR
jgi:hypothetical protein